MKPSPIERLKFLKKNWRWSLRRLFEEDPKRADKFWLDGCGISLDFSKNHLNREALQTLEAYSNERQLPEAIERLFTGDIVNPSENRPALHTALRSNSQASDQELHVSQCLAQMATIVETITHKRWPGFQSEPIRTVVHIGIGGSDLGPRMVCHALSNVQQDGIEVHFVANVDGADIEDTLKTCEPGTTLFIVASKSFSTLETMANANYAKQWLLEAGCEAGELHRHMIAVSANIDAAMNFGIKRENILPMWDWVGGRYSLWSAIGLPIAIAIGMDHFNKLLAGGRAMDEHFRSQPFSQNIPVMLAWITYWYSQFWDVKSQAILPYAQRLSKLPAYLQQLDMESLGKSVNIQGKAIKKSGIVLWGTEGTNGQHSFHQLLHQGTQLVPVDFIAVKEPMTSNLHQHQLLLSCCISQSQALLNGKTEADAINELKSQGVSTEKARKLAKHKAIAGNKPSNTLIMRRLDPLHLGALIAMYEHKVYTLGVMLEINPFDQWGVELGKQLSGPIFEGLSQGKTQATWDLSTQRLVRELSKKNHC